jgi:hypothetical protein
MKNNDTESTIHLLEQIILIGVPNHRNCPVIRGLTISGQLPIGADAPTFMARKKKICFGVFSKMVFSTIFIFGYAFLSFMFGLMTWAFIPNLSSAIFAITAVVFLLLSHQTYQQSKRYYQIWAAIKSLQPLA